MHVGQFHLAGVGGRFVGSQADDDYLRRVTGKILAGVGDPVPSISDTADAVSEVQLTDVIGRADVVAG